MKILVKINEVRKMYLLLNQKYIYFFSHPFTPILFILFEVKLWFLETILTTQSGWEKAFEKNSSCGLLS